MFAIVLSVCFHSVFLVFVPPFVRFLDWVKKLVRQLTAGMFYFGESYSWCLASDESLGLVRAKIYYFSWPFLLSLKAKIISLVTLHIDSLNDVSLSILIKVVTVQGVFEKLKFWLFLLALFSCNVICGCDREGFLRRIWTRGGKKAGQLLTVGNHDLISAA